MGTDVEVIVVDGPEGAAEGAEARIEELEARWSRFRPDSELSRLNRAGGTPAVVSLPTFRLVQRAVEAWTLTEHRFDPSVLPALEAAGYDRSFEEMPAEVPGRSRPTGAAPGCAGIRLDPVVRAVTLPPGVRLDLGGIGKGYAADRALVAMRSVSPRLAGALVDLGGDIAVCGGSPEGGPWLISVADPRRPGAALATLALDGGGVATSGRDARRFGPARSLHHLIDPETGEPALAGPLTVTVVAPDATSAEVHATTLAIAGLGEAEAHVDARPSLAALYVPHAGPAIPFGPLPLAQQRLVVSAA
jgi:thiamine biosynthesis lipoprotein